MSKPRPTTEFENRVDAWRARTQFRGSRDAAVKKIVTDALDGLDREVEKERQREENARMAQGAQGPRRGVGVRVNIV